MTGNSRTSNQEGFTLVEVLASIVILSIILVGVLNLFIFTNKAAVFNNDRLVAINLGRATFERVNISPTDYFQLADISDDMLREGKVFTSENCVVVNCQDLYTEFVNDRTYEIKLKISQDETEKSIQLVNVLVEIELPEENISHQVEGYVAYGTDE